VKRRVVLALCWAQIAAAAILLAISITEDFAGPSLEMTWHADGVVLAVLPDGVTDRAGIATGDRLVAVDGRSVGGGYPVLYSAAAGKPARLLLSRASSLSERVVVPETIASARRRASAAGGSWLVWAVSGYLRTPVNVWMLLLGTFLLYARPRVASARVAALEFAYWAGANVIWSKPGIGAMLAAVPAPAVAVIYAADLLALSMFFALVAHFAMIFPEPLNAVHARRSWQLVPYLWSLPVFLALAAEAARFLAPGMAGLPDLHAAALYDTIGPALLLSAGVLLAWRLRTVSDVNDRRRLRLIFLALLPGGLAFVLQIVFDRMGASALLRSLTTLGLWLGVAASSGTFAYAILRHRLFNIRLLVRRSIRYAFARGTLVAALALPAIALVAFLYRHRHESLSDLLRGRPMVYLVLAAAFTAALHYRRRLLDALDRRFFREQYDSRRMLERVVSTIRQGTDHVALARLALAEIEGALHPEHASLWRTDPAAPVLRREIAAGGRKEAPLLPRGATLVSLLSTDDDPLDVDPRAVHGLLRRLPETERAWLRDTGARLLVPIRSDTELTGFLLLGERLSEEPYGREDKSLLRLLSAQIALTQEYAMLKSSPAVLWTPHASQPTPSDGVRVCPTCQRCYPPDSKDCPEDHAPLSPPEGTPLLIEDKYRLVRLLGRGGMGSVYQAVQTRLNRPVAVKILLSHLLPDRSMRARFEQEARVVARLRHPAIVTVHDFGVLETGNAFLVMEYLDGSTLGALLRREGRLSTSRTVAILMPIGEALELAHHAGVVHRDLKPDNIMILPAGDGANVPAKVLDFGVAKLQDLAEGEEDDSAPRTRVGTLLGTPAYMAPELFAREPATARSDQYSLGVIAYQMLCGEPPFVVHGDLAAAALAHTQTVVPPLRDRVAHVPEAMAASIARALEKDPEKRFASARDFVRELARGMSTTLGTDSTPTIESR
jgi:eukaryotic-like serine/threonine-protein kinase